MQITPDPVSRYIHPRQALREVAELLVVKKIPAKVILNSPKHKLDREKFIGAMFCLAVRELETREVFLQQPRSDPPDFKLLMPTNRSIKDRPFDTTNVELVTIPPRIDHLNESEIKVASCKIVSEKLSPLIQVIPSTTLLIFLNTTHQNIACDGAITAIAAAQNIQYMSIWIIRILSFDSNTKDMVFCSTQLHPMRSRDIIISARKELEVERKHPSALLDKFTRENI
jgi:hypothetical protein